MSQPTRPPFRFPNKRYERVHDLIGRLVSEGLAQFFADAIALSQERPPFRTATHLVGHLIRDVESAVRDVLLMLPAVKALQAEGATPPRAPNPNKGKQDAHLREIDLILRALGLDTDAAASTWKSFAGDDAWARNAHRDDLRLPRRLDADFLTRLDRFVDVLAMVLDEVEANYASIIGAVDAILAKSTPTAEDVTTLARYLAPGVTALAHVFERLPSMWLTPLREARVFSEPPDRRTHDDGSTSFPSWPQAAYLIRIATEAPSEVASTILGIPTVENEEVHRQFLQAALRLPAKEAARVAIHEAHWLGAHPRWLSGTLLARSLQDVVLYLLGSGEMESAVALLRSALRPPQRGKEGPLHLDAWDFSQLARATLGKFGKADPVAATSLLFDLIGSEPEDGMSLSTAIDECGQDAMDDPRDVLVGELRDLLEEAANAGGEGTLRATVEQLESRRDGLSDRLALHLLRRHGRLAPDLVVTRAEDQQRLNSTGAFHEMASMIADQFPGLPPDGQQRIVAALRENTSVDASAGLLAEDTTEDGDVEDVARYARLRRRRWFAILGAARPADVEVEYRSLCEGIGEPENPTKLSWTTGLRTGPNAPISASDISSLTDAALLEYLKSWVPTSADPFEPSRNGLGRELKACASRDPARFSRLARDFRGLEHSYVFGVLWGLHEGYQLSQPRTESADAAQPLDWESILDLIDWTARPHDRQELSDQDIMSDWTSARQMAARVLEDAAFAASGPEDGRRKRAWELARVLINDADPTPARCSQNQSDDASFAINTVRGEALNAGVTMAALLRREGNRDADLTASIFAELERRLDPRAEPAFAIRSVLARRFENLFVADEKRACALADMMFPRDESASEERLALWRTFVSESSVRADIFDALQPFYRVAVDSVTTAESSYAADLGGHIVWPVVWGKIGPETADGLLKAYVARASTAARHEVLEDVGRVLHREEGSIAADALDRLMALWDWWSEAVAQKGDPKDLAAFGWWFSSSSIRDSTWLLSRLRRALELTAGELDWSHAVAERLASLVADDPGAVAACLSRFIEGGGQHRIHFSRDAIRRALVALRDGPEAATVKTIASRLLARGWSEFRELAEP